MLNRSAPRRMAVLRPLKMVIENYPRRSLRDCSRPRTIPTIRRRARGAITFGRELYIERDDFMENPPKKFFRLAPGREVRLRYGYFITCREVVKNAAGEVVELRCSYDPADQGRAMRPTDARFKATIALGQRPPRPCRQRCGCTIICSRRRSLTPTATSPRSSIPTSLRTICRLHGASRR